MDELDDGDLGQGEEIGLILKRLRGERSLRDVQRLTGVSSSYLSLVERGERTPGVNLINKLAVLYGVDANELLQRARRLGTGDPRDDEPLEVERAYQYVLADPQFRVGTRPDGPLSINAKRFIVEMYERFTGKRLLE
ncbi:MAG: helix-turn-helix transcriptional regulator [Chloroflexota bacterium]|nr:helix-turn-helix transcriptional regulator [Chloroflexota bacterium]MDE2941664.1 helix-turn-helix transcriptional regulator [Chloroflexota bacterium]MDE3267307.1 helix-turn-helix transcriptional regulator [Chloroflexota bacterium]